MKQIYIEITANWISSMITNPLQNDTFYTVLNNTQNLQINHL